jgi:hypothetical protein
MKRMRFTRARRVETEADREKVLAVLRATYLNEKAWVLDVDPMFPACDLQRNDVSWFLAIKNERPVGVLRVLYDPPTEQYLKYGLQPIDADLQLADLIKTHRIAEIGRFAVVPERRSGVGVVLSLMRAATREIVARGCSSLVTDVFENDPHSPLGFHTRIIGFKPVATHEFGELRFKGRRITMLLDVKAAYQSLKARGNWFFRVMTMGWSEAMHRRLAT